MGTFFPTFGILIPTYRNYFPYLFGQKMYAGLYKQSYI